MISSDHGLLALAFTVLAATCATYPTSAHASACGDDVDGARIACKCGDIIVSDTRLRVEDPVIMRRCELNGLALRARAGAQSITLDLNGLSILGSGAGTGIRVLRGGSRGATIIGGDDGAPGQIVGFRTGVSARGTNALASLSNLRVESNTRTGIDIDTNWAVLTNVQTLRNGGDGARLGGRNIDAIGLEARMNRGVGISISGQGHRLEGTAAENGEADISQRGHGEMDSIEVSK